MTEVRFSTVFDWFAALAPDLPDTRDCARWGRIWVDLPAVDSVDLPAVDSEAADVSSLSAHATAGNHAIAAPIPSATANAPMRPTARPSSSAEDFASNRMADPSPLNRVDAANPAVSELNEFGPRSIGRDAGRVRPSRRCGRLPSRNGR